MLAPPAQSEWPCPWTTMPSQPHPIHPPLVHINATHSHQPNWLATPPSHQGPTTGPAKGKHPLHCIASTPPQGSGATNTHCHAMPRPPQGLGRTNACCGALPGPHCRAFVEQTTTAGTSPIRQVEARPHFPNPGWQPGARARPLAGVRGLVGLAPPARATQALLQARTLN